MTLVNDTILFFVAIAASTIDALAGGGGLLTVPALMAAGLPPVMALGTNKLQASIGTFTASLHFIRKKKVAFKTVRLGVICSLIGAAIGTWTVQQVGNHVMHVLIPMLLVVVLVYVLIAPRLSKRLKHHVLPKPFFYTVFGLLMGFYDGFFGPGTGSIWIFLFMLFMSMNIVDASMHAKPLNFAANMMALLVFMLGGKIVYLVALIMGVGQIIGTRIGAHLVISKGHVIVRPLFVIVVSLMIVHLLWFH